MVLVLLPPSLNRKVMKNNKFTTGIDSGESNFGQDRATWTSDSALQIIATLDPKAKENLLAALQIEKRVTEQDKQMVYFTPKQLQYQESGKSKREALIRATKEAAERALGFGLIDESDKIDTILSGSTGIGKTWNTKKALKDIGLIEDEDYILLKQNMSMLGFAVKLAMGHEKFIRNKKNENEKLIIMVDDCDSFFGSKDERNILKGMTGKIGDRCLQWNKLVPSHMFTNEQQATILRYAHRDGSPGFTVPCDDVAFIFTTNFKFPTENQAAQMLAKSGPNNRSNAYHDLAALRSRCKTKDFMLEKEVNWGWIVEVCLNDNLLFCLDNLQNPNFSKWYLLNWIFSNWEKMTESNLRTVEDMAKMMLRFPDNYADKWEEDFIESNQAVLHNIR